MIPKQKYLIKIIWTLAVCALIFLASFFTSLSSQNIVNPLPYENSKIIEVNRVFIHYRVWKNSESTNKPWILLVHGFSGSTYSWRNIVDTLCFEGFNVIAVDVPPYGYSDKSVKINHSPDSRAELLWSFIDMVKPNAQWYLFGHSMGGGIVAAMSILKPQRVEKVVLISPSLFAKLSPGRSLRQRIVAFAPVELVMAGVGRLFLIRPKRIEKMLESSYGQKGSAEDVIAYYIPLKQKGMARAIISSFSRANPKNPLVITDFKTRTLAIWGKNDTWVPFERVKPYTEQIENISIILIKDTGHNPMETIPEVFNKIALDFLNSKD